MADSTTEAMLAPDPHTSRRLFWFGTLALAGGLFWLCHTSKLEDSLLMAAGSIILILAAWPALDWARRAEGYFPVFAIFMLTGGPFYAVPLLSGRQDVMEFSAAATWEAAASMIVFQVVAITAFTATRARPAREPLLVTSLVPERVLRYAQAGIWLNTAFLYVNGFTTLIPYEFNIVIRAMFFGIGTVSLFIESRRWGAGELSAGEKLVIAANVFVQVVFVFRELYLISGISILLLTMIGYVSTSRRLPLLLIAVALPLVAVLHNGKPTMRLHYWQERQPLPDLAATPAFFQEWFQRGLESTEPGEVNETSSLTGRLFERASLFHMLCLVAERTPESAPFLRGESYIYVPSQLIPSFLWPNKPSSMRSNTLLAVHYGLIDPEDVGSVSIAFGMIAEAYANFGLVGCALLGLVCGFAYKRITIAAVAAPQFSALGLFTVLVAAWSFQTEQIFASWVVSLIHATAFVIGVPLAFQLLARRT